MPEHSLDDAVEDRAQIIPARTLAFDHWDEIDSVVSCTSTCRSHA